VWELITSKLINGVVIQNRFVVSYSIIYSIYRNNFENKINHPVGFFKDMADKMIILDNILWNNMLSEIMILLCNMQIRQNDVW
jgi:hypothetical protein